MTNPARSTPSIEEVTILSAFFNVSTDYLLGIEKPAAHEAERPVTRDDEIIAATTAEIAALPLEDKERILEIIRAYKRK